MTDRIEGEDIEMLERNITDEQFQQWGSEAVASLPPAEAPIEIVATDSQGEPLKLTVVDGEPTGDITEEEATLLELDATLTEQNTTMFTQLAILNQSPGPMLLIHVQIQTLIDLLVDDEDSHRKFEIACQLRLNQELKARLAHAVDGLQVPGGQG